MGSQFFNLIGDDSVPDAAIKESYFELDGADGTEKIDEAVALLRTKRPQLFRDMSREALARAVDIAEA